MSKKFRNLTIMAAVLAFSALLWSAAAAQDATAEPTAEATAEATMAAPVAVEPTMEATMEATEPMAEATDEAGAPMQGRPLLGVGLQDGANGVTIGEVVPGSAAETAG